MTATSCEPRLLQANPDDLGAVLRDCMEVTQRLALTHEKLQHEVTRLREELAAKNLELERSRRLAELGEMAAGVAHEVRNPLGAIQLYNNLLRRTCGGESAAHDLIEKIDAGIRAIDGVVQDTLALAPRSGRITILELNNLIQNAADLSSKRLAERQVRLLTGSVDSSLAVEGEVGALSRVLLNLIVNAAEASEPQATITVEAQARGDEVAILVCDNGCGISEDILQRVFDPFFTTKKQGTGLGLAIAYRIVNAHGGRLTARNRAQGGCEFSMILPLFKSKSGIRTDAAARQNVDAA